MAISTRFYIIGGNWNTLLHVTIYRDSILDSKLYKNAE